MVRHIVVGDANNRQIAMRSIGTLQDVGVARVAGYGMKTLLGEGMKFVLLDDTQFVQASRPLTY